MSALPTTPTLATYGALERAFDHFNRELFDTRLPLCLLTLRSSPRTYGYMHRRRFVNVGGVEVDELGINPGYFAIQSTEEVLATVVHEMVHHWQNHFGSPSKSLPHNREWAEKMVAIGLMPSHNGLPGGKRTGRSMSDYILPDGKFLRTCGGLVSSGFSFPWLDSHLPEQFSQIEARREMLVASGLAAVGGDSPLALARSQGVNLRVTLPSPKRGPTRERFVCPQCGIRAWAAPDTNLACGVCGVPLTS
jgi:hypothetical protein